MIRVIDSHGIGTEHTAKTPGDVPEEIAATRCYPIQCNSRATQFSASAFV